MSQSQTAQHNFHYRDFHEYLTDFVRKSMLFKKFCENVQRVSSKY